MEKEKSDCAFSVTVVVLVIIFLTGWIVGAFGPTLMNNNTCYALLGCNAGFFGFDAALHFFGGITIATLIIWLMRRFPAVTMFHERFWKNFLTLIALASFIAISWELVEFSGDHFKMKILHEDLVALNQLKQSGNSDTMGDMTFFVLGAALAARAFKSKLK